MAATASRKSSATGPVLRSTASPSLSGRFYTSHSSASTGFASSTSSFSSRTAGGFFTRAASPPRVSLARPSPSAQSVRFSLLDRPTSPSRSISVSPHGSGSHHRSAMKKQINTTKRTCMCSPTSHPGSFRCSLHKNTSASSSSSAVPYSQNRLNARRSAMTNSLVRIGGVEGEIVKRALAALIRPSSHSQRRRADFRPRPSRLSAMSKCSDSSPLPYSGFIEVCVLKLKPRTAKLSVSESNKLLRTGKVPILPKTKMKVEGRGPIMLQWQPFFSTVSHSWDGRISQETDFGPVGRKKRKKKKKKKKRIRSTMKAKATYRPGRGASQLAAF
ncbi:hypothetical protein ACLB2K_005005 [Fragaria x ananassa]